MSFSATIKRIAAGVVAMGLMVALSASGVAAAVGIASNWVSGTSHTKPTANNRLLVVMAMGEHSADVSVTGVTYGGQAMTKQNDAKNGTGYRTYASIFTLDEGKINAASSGAIAVTWSATPASGSSVYSVFLKDVDQGTPVSAKAQNNASALTISTSSLSAASGDLIIFDGGTQTNYTIVYNNSFTKVFESDASWGDGVGAYKFGTGTSQTPSFTITGTTANQRMAICAIVVKQATGSVPNYTLTVTDDGRGRTTPTGSITVAQGAATSITAIPVSGNFKNWTVTSGTASIANTTSSSTTVTLTSGNATVQANFTAPTTAYVYPEVTGPGESMKVDQCAIGFSATDPDPIYTLDVNGDAHISGNVWLGSTNNYLLVGYDYNDPATLGAGGAQVIVNAGNPTYEGCVQITTGGLVVKDGSDNPAPIECKSIKIRDWTIEAPDYVFEKDYKLASLSDVEKHIAEKKHLPGVPSAQEMKKGGVDLSEMNMTLLKKVEELTLYMIAQNKKIEAQQHEIQKLTRAVQK